MNCPDCQAKPGAIHMDGCDVERCPWCRGQALSCRCDDAPDSEREPWAGEWPGKAECRHFGLWCRDLDENGVPLIGREAFDAAMAGGHVRFHVQCSAGDIGATEDLNRWCELGNPRIGEECEEGEMTTKTPRSTRGLISRMADKLQAWLDSEDCECPPEGCFCGRPELEALISEARAVAAGLSPGERR